MTTALFRQMGALLRKRRERRGLRDTAKEIGVSPATLSRIENGKQPDLLTFEKLCRWLEISPLAFLDMGDAAEPGAAGSDADPASAHLRAERHLTPALAQALGELIVRGQEMLARDPDEGSFG